MQFRTEVKFDTESLSLEFPDGILSMGSCFSENIGERMKSSRMNIVVNPFGILYNPASIENALLRLIKKESYNNEGLTEIRRRYYSFDHHGNFSDESAQAALEKMNKSLEKASEHLRKAKVLIITFGTAYCYVHKELNKVVANCHKLPDDTFKRIRLTSEEIVRNYSIVFEAIKKINPTIKVCLTISPIRHWRDGAVENNRSKAVLIIAVAELTKLLNEYVTYFPSYEYLMDELRDYRFYASDMLHPNELALDFVIEKFKMTHLTAQCRKVVENINKLNRARQHRPLFPKSAEYEKFKEGQRKNIKQLKKQFPFLELEEDYQFFR